MFCTQEYSGRRVVKHNFRYRVLLCFLNVIYAPSCNRCVLITPVPGARSPCTSPSAWGSFPYSIEPRGMHQRGALPLPPLSMQLSAGMGGACVPSPDAPALVPVCASAFVSHQETAGSARPSTPLHARPLAHSPAYPHSSAAHRPPRTPTARTCFRLPARPWIRTPARPPACFRPPSPSPSLSFPALFPCLTCLNSALFAES